MLNREAGADDDGLTDGSRAGLHYILPILVSVSERVYAFMVVGRGISNAKCLNSLLPRHSISLNKWKKALNISPLL